MFLQGHVNEITDKFWCMFKITTFSSVLFYVESTTVLSLKKVSVFVSSFYKICHFCS